MNTVSPAPPLCPEEAEEMERYGIVRIPVCYYHVGEYRYTDLKDAIAEAKRRETSGRP